ncbi:MAG TPA: zf-HC2 domain-containing protein [Ktedonobacterales bacterium]|nr:zf-HC2 domain-containing protein [Ktedonobacterales bacterium]
MSADTIPVCAEGQTAASLSEWRDGALSPAEAERLRQHIESCAACQSRLAEYDAIADGLRAIHVPDPIGGYGRNPRLSPASVRPRSRLPLPSLTATPRLRLAGSLGAVAAVLLIALAFAQVFAGFSREPGARRTPTATVTLSSTPVALPPLSWQALPPLPDGVAIGGLPYLLPYSESGPLLFGATEMTAPSDGATAYACAMQPPYTGGSPPTKSVFFATHDTGQTWSPVLTIPVEHGATACIVTVDALDPETVVASSAFALRTMGPSPNTSVTYLSQDGGIHWQRLPGDQLILQPATRQGVTYALHEVQTGTFSNEPANTDLAVSRDGMQSWTPIDGPIMRQSGEKYLPQRFWLNPDNGNLLVETLDPSNNDAPTLWHSEDSGTHWQPFGQPPAMSSSINYHFVVQSPAAGQSWYVCLAGYDASGQGQNILTCTSDNGAVWTSRSVLNPPSAPPAKMKGPGTSIGAALVFAIGDDSAVLALAAQGVALDGSITGYTLFRLPHGASQWQSLGPVPEFSVLYVPAPGNGILWAFPAQGILLDPHNRVFTVPYP